MENPFGAFIIEPRHQAYGAVVLFSAYASCYVAMLVYVLRNLVCDAQESCLP